MNVAIMQPAYWPWSGFFELVAACDTFVHLDDAAFTRGGFINRVQLKHPRDRGWLTVPVRRPASGRPIDRVRPTDGDWATRHADAVASAFRDSPFGADAIRLFMSVTPDTAGSLADLGIATVEAAVAHLGLRAGRRFVRSSRLDVGGTGTARVLDLCLALGATTYVTGHGARRYLDHDAFERAGIRVTYLDYLLDAYDQPHGPFAPHVSILDPIANLGARADRRLRARTIPWREFLADDQLVTTG